jgi:hypothetical protein
MRLLLVSDLHYKLRQYDWLLCAAPRTPASHAAVFSPASFLASRS